MPSKVSRGRYLPLFLCLALGGCVVDLVTKNWIFAWRGFPGTKPSLWFFSNWIGDTFGFTTSLNEGALAGIGHGNSLALAGLSTLALIGIVYYLVVRGGASQLPITIALGLITAGILGNLYDRLGMHGLQWPLNWPEHENGGRAFAVRDWLWFKIDAIGFNWPIFNIADSFLVVGALLLIALSLFPRTAAESIPKKQPSAPLLETLP